MAHSTQTTEPVATATASTLPFEILSEIFKDASEKYQSYGYRRPRSVKACSLVCSTWRNAAQHEIFSELTIHNHRKPSQEFYSAVIHDPLCAHLSAYIKHLFIYADTANLSSSFGSDWPKFLSSLSNIRSVTFARGENGPLLDPSYFSNEQRTAFLQMLRSPLMAQLVIDQTRDFPFPIIGCCPNLKSLVFQGTYDPIKPMYPPNCNHRLDLNRWSGNSEIQLRELKVSGTCRDIVTIHSFMETMPWISFSQLKRLELAFSSWISIGAGGILEYCTSVEELVLDFSKGFHLRAASDRVIIGVDPKIVQRIVKLRHFHAKLHYSCHYSTCGPVAQYTLETWVFPLLENLPRPEFLESVDVQIKNTNAHSPPPSNAMINRFMEAAGNRLDNLIQNTTKFTGLKRSSIHYPWTGVAKRA